MTGDGMTESQATLADLPDVRKSITVPAPPDEAFRISVGFPIEWLPSAPRRRPAAPRAASQPAAVLAAVRPERALQASPPRPRRS
jgi:hypothetical protein